MAMTFDNKYLFLGCTGELRQYRLDDHTLAKSYPFDQRILSVITTYDNRHAFIGLEYGEIYEISIDSDSIIKNYGRVHKS